jgi:hypothetical protein
MHAHSMAQTSTAAAEDFTPTEIQSGRALYFEEKDNRSSGMEHQIRRTCAAQ